MTITCANCGRVPVAKHTGRKRHYCSDRCRDRARKSRRSAFRGTVLVGNSRQPRNAGNSGTISKTCKPVLGGRASVNPQLWHAIVELEVFAGRAWREVTSRDGVRSEVAVLRPRALREVGP